MKRTWLAVLLAGLFLVAANANADQLVDDMEDVSDWQVEGGTGTKNVSSDAKQGAYSMVYTFTSTSTAMTNFVAKNWNPASQDWSAYNRLIFWLKVDSDKDTSWQVCCEYGANAGGQGETYWLNNHAPDSGSYVENQWVLIVATLTATRTSIDYIKFSVEGSWGEVALGETFNIFVDDIRALTDDSVPPAGISALTALPGAAERSIRLQWAAPGNSGITGNLDGYYEVKYTSVSQITKANYGNPPSPSYSVLFASSSVAPLAPCSYVITSLVPGASYWFAMKACDCVNWSVWTSSGEDITVNNLAFSYATPISDFLPPAAISNLTALTGAANGTVKLRWTAPGNDDVSNAIADGIFRVRYSSHAIITSANFDNVPYSNYTVDIPTSNVSFGDYCSYTTPASLVPGATYWFAVKTYDGANWSVWVSSGEDITVNNLAFAYAAIDNTPPAAISNLTALPGASEGSVKLRWTAPGNDETSNAIADGIFRVRYSSHAIITAANFDSAPYSNYTVDIPTSNVSPGDYCSYTTPATLVPGATYWFAVKTYDGTNWSVWTSSGEDITVNNLAFAYAYKIPLSGDIIWTADFSPSGASHWAAYGAGASTDSVGGSLVLYTTLNNWDAGGVYPINGEVTRVPVNALANGKLNYNVSSISANATFDIALDEFDTNGAYVATKWNVVANPAETGSQSQSLAGLTYDAGTVSVLPKINMHTTAINQNLTVASMSFEGDNTAPGAVTDLAFSGTSTESSIGLAWSSPGDNGYSGTLPSGSNVSVQYSTDPNESWTRASAQYTTTAPGIPCAPGTSVGLTIPSLTRDTTYYFRAWISDEASNWSDISNGATGYTELDSTPPGVDAEEISKAGILGQPIVFVSTATDSNSGVGYIRLWYKLYSGSWATADMSLTGISGGSRGEYTLAGDKINQEGSIYYFVQAADNRGNAALWKSLTEPQVITVSRTTEFPPVRTGSVSLPNNDPKHGEVKLDIPAGALPAPVAITITQGDASLEPAVTDDTVDRSKNSGKPVAAYSFGPTGTNFAKPVTLTLLYFDPNDTGIVQLEDGSLTSIDENTSALQIFYWDGVQWRLLGGTVDKTKNTVSVKINHFSKYAIFPLGSAALFSAPEEKFITPMMPATFGYKAEEVTVYDIAGNQAVDFTKEDFGGGTIQWNGYDEEGRFVESGVYIYRIKTTEGKSVYGVIVVAK
ncbi:MAG: hypothetical protein ABII64_00710 [Elusimicrobiota bacterium]